RYRHRRGTVLPDLQPRHQGAALRPGRRVRAPVGPRAGTPAGQGRTRAVEAPRWLPAQLPAADHRPRRPATGRPPALPALPVLRRPGPPGPAVIGAVSPRGPPLRLVGRHLRRPRPPDPVARVGGD